MPQLRVSIQHEHNPLAMELKKKGRRVHVIIDSWRTSPPWGESSVRIDPGEHTITVYVQWVAGLRCGRAQTTVLVDQNDVTLIYLTPLFIFLRGRLYVQ